MTAGTQMILLKTLHALYTTINLCGVLMHQKQMPLCAFKHTVYQIFGHFNIWMVLIR